MAHYTIDDKKKTVTADIEKLTDKELKIVQKYTVLGYGLVTMEKEEKEPVFTNANIVKFLTEKKTKAELKTFEDKKAEKNKKGKKKGFINAQRWFRSEYKDEFLEYMK